MSRSTQSAEQEAIDRETRDISGFELPVDSSLPSTSGYDDIHALVEQEMAFANAAEAEARAFVHEIDRQRMAAVNASKRAEALYELEAISEEDYREIADAAAAWHIKMIEKKRLG